MGPVPCGLTFLERLRSQTVDPSLQETRSLRYDDSEALAQSFGADAKERMMEETKGLGPGFRDPRSGELSRWDPKSHEPVPISSRDLENVYLGGPVVDET